MLEGNGYCVVVTGLQVMKGEDRVKKGDVLFYRIGGNESQSFRVNETEPRRLDHLLDRAHRLRPVTVR